MSPLANAVFASASGLKPNQKLAISKRYGYDSASEKYTAGPDGTWESLINTENAMQPKGKASISLSDGSCTVSVTLDYGPGELTCVGGISAAGEGWLSGRSSFR
jgi:hypothetical protein